jgi:hypothetical protein
MVISIINPKICISIQQSWRKEAYLFLESTPCIVVQFFKRKDSFIKKTSLEIYTMAVVGSMHLMKPLCIELP